MISLGSRLIACCKLSPTLARQMWRHNYVIDRNEYLIFTLLESINPLVYSLQFLFKSTNNSWRYERKCEWVFFFWTQCRISPPCFLAECCIRRLNQDSFVLLCFVLFAFFGIEFSLCIVCIFNLSSVLYFPACINVNGTV